MQKHSAFPAEETKLFFSTFYEQVCTCDVLLSFPCNPGTCHIRLPEIRIRVKSFIYIDWDVGVCDQRCSCVVFFHKFYSMFCLFWNASWKSFGYCLSICNQLRVQNRVMQTNLWHFMHIPAYLTFSCRRYCRFTIYNGSYRTIKWLHLLHKIRVSGLGIFLIILLPSNGNVVPLLKFSKLILNTE